MGRVRAPADDVWILDIDDDLVAGDPRTPPTPIGQEEDAQTDREGKVVFTDREFARFRSARDQLWQSLPALAEGPLILVRSANADGVEAALKGENLH